MSSSEVDVVVIGAGVVGLACAAEIAARGQSVCLLERHGKPGLDTSTHNSGVIHAGIYYPPGTLKARLCVEGKRLMYELLRAARRASRRSGKLIVAPSSTGDTDAARSPLCAGDSPTTSKISRWSMPDFVRAREPHVRATAALWSGSTGILEAEALVRALKHVCDARDVMLRGRQRDHCRRSTMATAGRPHAERIGHGGDRRELRPACTPTMSRRCSAARRSGSIRAGASTPSSRRRTAPGQRPRVPGAPRLGHGLGVHATKTTWGSVLLGPTIRFQARKDDYEADRAGARRFSRADARTAAERHARRSATGRQRHPREAAPAEGVVRRFHDSRDAKVPALVHVAGIDSPGLTSCLAIARMWGGSWSRGSTSTSVVSHSRQSRVISSSRQMCKRDSSRLIANGFRYDGRRKLREDLDGRIRLKTWTVDWNCRLRLLTVIND